MILRQPQVWHSAAFCFMSMSNLPLQTGHFTQASSFSKRKQPLASNNGYSERQNMPENDVETPAKQGSCFYARPPNNKATETENDL
jgi:hypothetical protein